MPKRSLVHHLADVVHGSARWLSADPRDVLVFTPREGAKADSGGVSGADLGSGLGRWQRAMAASRRLVVARRALTVAALVLVALLLVRVAGASVAGWLLVALPLVASAAVAATAAALKRPRLGLERVAQLLDRRLSLSERLGTAWELQTGDACGAGRGSGNVTIGADGPLAARVLAQGDRLVWDVQERFRVRPAPAGRAWAGLLAAATVAVGLVVVGPGGSDGGAGGSGSANGSAGADASASANAAGARGAATTPAAPSTTGSTTPLTGAQPATATTPGQPSAATSTAPRAAAGTTPPSIAVRAQPSTAAGQGAASGSTARPGGAGTAARAGTSNGAAKGSWPAAVAPAPASLPAPRQIKGIPAQGQKATHAQSTNQTTTSASRSGARGSSQSGTRGAGSKAGRVGSSGTQAQSAAATQSLPLRSLATNGGRERGTSAGKAGTGGKGRGTARTQRGTATGAPVTGAAAPLPLVPTAGNLIVPSLQALVSAYFTAR